MNAYDIILRPVITEQSMESVADKKYVFMVALDADKTQIKAAVEAGYWHLFRYDPRLKNEGKNPFQLDSKEPDTSKVMDFLMGENRFASLKNNFPDKADALYAKEVEDVKARYAKYKKLAEG